MSVYVCIEKQSEEVKYFLSESINNVSNMINIANYKITKLPEFMKLTLHNDQLIKC